MAVPLNDCACIDIVTKMVGAQMKLSMALTIVATAHGNTESRLIVMTAYSLFPSGSFSQSHVNTPV